MINSYYVCRAEELREGERKIISIEGLSIGVFNVKGAYYALRNTCPHKWAPLCLGPLTGHAKSEYPGRVEMDQVGEILRCPWHGWEFDIKTGRSVFNPHKVRVKAYEVCVEHSRRGEINEAADESVLTFPVNFHDEKLYVRMESR